MKIICIGQNYIDHIKEMGNEIPSQPVIFLKPDSAILRKNAPFFIPDFSNEIHHELELVVKINRIGKNIPVKFASRYFDEITLGVDFTARDIQREMRKTGMPWEIAKAFDGSAPIGDFVSTNEISDINNASFHLLKNGEMVQKGNTENLLFKIDEIISHVSKYFTLKIGDLIFTGTPSGVGKVEVGDRLQAYLEDKKIMDFKIC
ncbi:MAG TPA: 2-hydroxyhepta-2,4-diene-1,7-dioate isomerase [Bacteroidales bacterium]|nr:MAG: 2-hydroxyhepta-2,4-diene-1,7-dioate isomerase [Bacteroidetes bacterium GWF2_33_38]OFY74023.1 MAG: 2-hydroxyhepta-2,4-diene-1,7-dioate isomerase [Bacteroidetes bacterium RIFOXYA12_FULL_33_9]OFY88752.1 MAG: 2-hydroxyhepta-2,4-diene-1,7-dioate isomerase [Bacteroidetes bacterium RIFOXYA2_FULL_33_7]HBF87736.1 2-hydroxyhepta-2,4-diene-1,7-dioate isomerase [Bacteroidales bacterium]